LSSAFLLLAHGGSLVYATCSINPEENDGVARRLVEKYKDECVVDRPDCSAAPEIQGHPSPDCSAEETRYGLIVLPDFSKGAGPMYIARFTKRA
jgi:16S rRNA (cytosine1407-C5)-methyltransferase